MDRLAEEELVCRQPNPADYRSVIAGRTAKGAALFREIRQIMREAAATM